MHSAKIIGATMPLMGDVARTSEDLLSYCARVSATANQKNFKTGWRLLRSLVRRKEWSPFEMVSVTMEITTTRDIARQILRHRSFSFQEFSQRYAAVDMEELVLREARDQHPTDRQASVATTDGGVQDWWIGQQRAIRNTISQTYLNALAMGMAKEVARTILPEGMTPSRLYMAGTLRSWIHYTQLRSAHGTQLEHQLVAASAMRQLDDLYPSLVGVLNEGEQANAG